MFTINTRFLSRKVRVHKSESKIKVMCLKSHPTTELDSKLEKWIAWIGAMCPLANLSCMLIIFRSAACAILVIRLHSSFMVRFESSLSYTEMF